MPVHTHSVQLPLQMLAGNSGQADRPGKLH